LIATLFWYIIKFRNKHQSNSQSQSQPIPSNSELFKEKLQDIQAEFEEKYQSRAEMIKKELEEKNQLYKEKLRLEKETQVQEKEATTRSESLKLQKKLEEKELFLEQKSEDISKQKEEIDLVKTELRSIKQNLLSKAELLKNKQRQFEAKWVDKLEQASRLKLAEAREIILEKADQEFNQNFNDWMLKKNQLIKEKSNIEARNIVAMAIQRCASEVANDHTLTTIKLADDEDKGKIIGKGGRNIQWLEKTLGVEIIIDETPNVVTVSGFSSIRRHIAKKTLEKLIEDGRIHPSSIEDMYQKSKSEVAEEIAEAGQWAVNELGIYDFPAKLIRIIGRLKFRSSYGQNMLKHSVEMARLARSFARQINAKFPNRKNPVDEEICIKGALLHDVGKGFDEEKDTKGNHIEIGEKICDNFGLDWKIRKAVSSHHDESYYDPVHGFCIEAVIVDACDNLSGGRPGARKESLEAYVQRVETIENIAKKMEGVVDCWVVKGSREAWVIFDTEEVSSKQMPRIMQRIAESVESQIKTKASDTIKFIGLREEKYIEYAK
jgi:ribonuclease Y